MDRAGCHVQHHQKNKTCFGAQEGWRFKALTSSAPGTQVPKLFCQQSAAFGFPWGTWKLFTAAGDSCPLHGQWTNYSNAPNSEALSGRLLHFCKPLHALLKQFVSNNLLSLLVPQHLLQVHEALTAASQLPYSHPTITKGFPHPPCPRRKQSHSFPKPCK